MKLTMEEAARQRICHVAFWRSLQVAMAMAGGGYSWARIKDLRVEELCDLLCTNGIRFVYLPECSYGGDPNPHDYCRSGGEWNGEVRIS